MEIKVEHVDGFHEYDCSGLAADKKNFFIDRRKNLKKILFVLAGYKPYLYEDVLGRVKMFVPADMEICLISSGLYDERLNTIAADNGWSYVVTGRNCLTMAQNIAIALHPEAEYLFKMDEDIFVTKHCFHKILDTYNRVLESGLYNIGFVAPLIPINGYGHIRVLRKLGMIGMYEKMFEKVKCAAGGDRMIEKSPDAAKFFWGEGGFIPSIDYMDEEFYQQEFSYSVCPIRFSIGMILMHRDLWKAMGTWTIPENGSGLGLDEVQLARYCITWSKAMIIAENTVVGHLSFGQQNKAMKEYHATHRECFRPPRASDVLILDGDGESHS